MVTEISGEARTVNTLDDASKYKLFKYLEKNRITLCQQPRTDDEVADMISKELKFPVSRCNIRKAKKVTGIAWPVKKNHVSADELKNTRRAWFILARSVRKFYTSMGYQADPEFIELCKAFGIDG
jgi:hypothetical protein